MLINLIKSEESAIQGITYRVCARTVPKAYCIDHIGTAIRTGADKDRLNEEMHNIGKTLGEYKTIMGIPLSISGKSVFYEEENYTKRKIRA